MSTETYRRKGFTTAFCLLSGIFFSSICCFAIGENNEFVNHYSKKLSAIEDSYKINLIGIKKSKKIQNRLNNSPKKVKIKPSYISAPIFIKSHGIVKLDDFTPEKLIQLTENELKELLSYLSQIPVKLKWYDNKGKARSKSHGIVKAFTQNRWEKTNAAAALAFLIALSKERDLLAKIIGFAPEAIISIFHHEAAIFIDSEVAAKVLVTIILQLNPSNTKQIASLASQIVQNHIAYWGQKNSFQHTYALTELIYTTSRLIDQHTGTISIKQKGILLGAMLSGTYANAKKIKSKDKKRIFIINSISNMLWALATYVGAIPMATTVAAAIAGTLSIGSVAAIIINSKIEPRDFFPDIREIEGQIEMSALEIANSKCKECLVEILELLAWMKATIHANGLGD